VISKILDGTTKQFVSIQLSYGLATLIKLAFLENIITTVSDYVHFGSHTYMRKYFDYVSLSAEQAPNALGDAIAINFSLVFCE